MRITIGWNDGKSLNCLKIIVDRMGRVTSLSVITQRSWKFLHLFPYR